MERTTRPIRLRHATRLRGITLIDTLVATIIMTIAMFGSIGIFYTTTNMAGKTAENSVAESLIRAAVETARGQGFTWCNTAGTSAPCDGSSTAYYDQNGEPTTVSLAHFTVVTSVVSSSLTSGVPNSNALRTLTVTVTRTKDSTVLETSGSYLTWGGV